MLTALFEIIYLAAIVSGVIIAILLFKKHHNKTANRICAAYIGVLLVPLWNGYVHYNPALSVLSLNTLQLFYPWLFGPLLYLYCYTLFGQNLRLWRATAHLVWVPLVACSYWATEFAPWNYQDFFSVYRVAIFVQIFAYIGWTIAVAKRHMTHLESYYAAINPHSQEWLLYLLYGLCGLFMLDLLLIGIDLFALANKRWVVDIFYLSESLYIVGMGLLALYQPKMLMNPTSEQVKYKNSGLTQSQAADIAACLHAKMQQNRWYQENDLTLKLLAHRLSVPEHHLSQVLSEQIQQSFYEYVNRLRIADAQQLLAENDPQYRSIIDVAFQVGFNNKASFNSAFKRFTKLTPSQYRNNASL